MKTNQIMIRQMGEFSVKQRTKDGFFNATELLKAMQKVGEALNWIVFDSHEPLLRNKHGNESKQRELWQPEKKVADLINEGFILDYDILISYLRKQYQKRNLPNVFQSESNII